MGEWIEEGLIRGLIQTEKTNQWAHVIPSFRSIWTHPSISLSLSGRDVQSGLSRVNVLLKGDNLVIQLLQLGLLLLLHVDRHVVVLVHHQSHHLLVLHLHRCLSLYTVVLEERWGTDRRDDVQSV